MQKDSDGGEVETPHPDPVLAPGATARAAVFVPVLGLGHPLTQKAMSQGTYHAPAARLAEAIGLAAAIDLEVVADYDFADPLSSH